MAKKAKKEKLKGIDKEINTILQHADKLEKEQFEDVSHPEIEPEFVSLDESELVSGESLYNIFCPSCGCSFDAYESDCGKPPFDIECPECGSLCSVN